MIRLRLPKMGDRVAFHSPSSPSGNVHQPDIAYNCLYFGFEPIITPHFNEDGLFLAGPDDHRASDLNDAIADPEIRALFPFRGGYGAARILPNLRYDLLKQDPKPLLGFSDITALHLAFSKEGIPSLHGPNLGSRLSDFSRDHLVRVMSTQPAGETPWPEGMAGVTVNGGRAEGALVGGNLAVLASLVGTPFMPSFKGKILFLEDVNEAPYRVDRLFTQLHLAGLMNDLAGIALGQFTEAGDEAPRIPEVLAERTYRLGIPVLSNLPFGHVRENLTLPVGMRAALDASAGTLTLLESPFAS